LPREGTYRFIHYEYTRAGRFNLLVSFTHPYDMRVERGLTVIIGVSGLKLGWFEFGWQSTGGRLKWACMGDGGSEDEGYR